jgi:hypothetical protein
MSGCWPPRVLVKPILEIKLAFACMIVSHRELTDDSPAKRCSI